MRDENGKLIWTHKAVRIKSPHDEQLCSYDPITNEYAISHMICLVHADWIFEKLEPPIKHEKVILSSTYGEMRKPPRSSKIPALITKAILCILLIALMCFGFDANANEVNDSEELECLALNIYHEARNESALGQVIVAMVTMERVRDNRFRKDTVCEVVHGSYVPGRIDCWFSWYCDGKPDTPYNIESYEQAIAIAKIIYYNYDYMTHPLKGADHYHATYVNPRWNEHMTKLGIVGTHVIWKWEK